MQEVWLREKINQDLIIYTSGNGTAVVKATATARQKYSLQVADMSGRTLWTQQGHAQAGNNTFPLPAAHLAAGIYLVRLQLNEQTVVGKLAVR